LHVTFDPALQPGVVPVYLIEPGFSLQVPIDKQARPVMIEPLAAQYESYSIGPQIQYVKLDFTSVPGFEDLSLDVIAGESNTWERKKIAGPIFEFCRSDLGQNYDQFKLVVSNAKHRADGKVSGNYKVTAMRTCPARWSGFLKHTYTDDEVWSYADQNHTLQVDKHYHVGDIWTFVGTTPGTAPDFHDTIDAVWAGSVSIMDYSSEHIPASSCQNETVWETAAASGSGTGPEQFTVFPVDEHPDQVALQPVGSSVNSFLVTGTHEWEKSCGSHFSGATQGMGGEDTGPLGSIGTVFIPDANDPEHYSGSVTLYRQVTPRGDDGQEVSESRVEWDFRRSR
jgi:hypothetical protein